MMKFKRKMAMMLALTTLCSAFTACGKKNVVVTEEDWASVPEDTYEIQWYLSAKPQADQKLIEEELNNYLKDKINATVKMHFMESAQYSKKLTTMISAGQYFDLFWCASYMLNYKSNAQLGALYPLDDYFDTALKDTIEQTPDVMMESLRMTDGKIYGLPVLKEYSMSEGWIYRKDIADKYGIDMSKYKNYEELEPVLEMIKEKEPDMNYPVEWDSSTTPIAVDDDATISPTPAINIVKVGENNYKVDLQPVTEEFIRCCNTARRYYEKGLIRKDIMTAESSDRLNRAKEGKIFALWSSLKPGKVNELFPDSQYQWAQIDIKPNYIDASPGTGSIQAISATSKNPARVARFLNILNTDPYVKNLVLYGIEGKHYEKIDEKTVKVFDNTRYNISESSWKVGNVYLDYITEKDDPNRISDLKAFSDAAVKRPYWSLFKFDGSEVEDLTAVIAPIKSEFAEQCTKGGIDPEEPLKAYAEKLKSVGAMELVAEVEKQFNEYMKSEK